MAVLSADKRQTQYTLVRLLPQSGASHLDKVSTTCDSGWVDVEHAIFLMILNADVDPPAIAGGTDFIQQ
jgi:hypothetical protein